MIDLLKQIFACGNYKTIEEYKEKKGITIEDIKKNEWVLVDLPEGALNMKDECLKKTHERLQSKAYTDLREDLQNAAMQVGVQQAAQQLNKAHIEAK